MFHFPRTSILKNDILLKKNCLPVKRHGRISFPPALMPEHVAMLLRGCRSGHVSVFGSSRQTSAAIVIAVIMIKELNNTPIISIIIGIYRICWPKFICTIHQRMPGYAISKLPGLINRNSKDGLRKILDFDLLLIVVCAANLSLWKAWEFRSSQELLQLCRWQHLQ